MSSESLMTITKDDFKIYVSYIKEELEELKKQSKNNKNSLIYFDEKGTFNYLFLD